MPSTPTPTITLGSNPNRSDVGKLSTEAVTIATIWETGHVTYEITKSDGSNAFRLSTGLTDLTGYTNVISLSQRSLVIILKLRTKYKVRIKRNSGAWSPWVEFKTRDKSYKTPDAITQLDDNTSSTANRRGNRRIVVTNSAKATKSTDSRGARIENSDKVFNSTTSITYTSRGARIVNND